MRNLFLYPAIVLCMVLAINCTKVDTDNNSSLQSAKEFFTITTETTPTGSVYTLNSLELNGSLRWKKQSWGFFTGGINYADGILYVAGGAPDYSSKFSAYDINTGAVIWSKNGTPEKFYEPHLRNDTMYCISAVQINPTTTNGYIAAYNAKSGEFYWKHKVTEQYWPYSFMLEGNSAYFIFTDPVSAATRLGSFNLTTKTFNWLSSVGIPVVSSSSAPIYSSDKIFITDGLKRMRALSKTTGQVVWTNSDRPFEQPMYGNGSVYAASSSNGDLNLNGVYCLDAASGTIIWHWRSDMLSSIHYRPPIRIDNKVYYANSDAGGSFIKAFNATTGEQQWRTNVSSYFEWIKTPIIIGKNIYTLNEKSDGWGQHLSSKIFTYNADTGAPMDSLLLPSKPQSFFIVRAEE